MKPRPVWLNGLLCDPACIPVDDLALRGFGVFTTLLAEDGAPVWLGDHIRRVLAHAAQVDPAISEAAAGPLAHIEPAIRDLLRACSLREGRARVRIMISPGENALPRLPSPLSPNIFVTVSPALAPADMPPARAIFARDVRRGNPRFDLYARVKSAYGNTAAPLRAAAEAGANEALIPDHTGEFIACGTSANLLIEENGRYASPPESDGALAGVALAKLCTLLDVRRESLPPARILEADAVYLTNSLQGARQILTLEGRSFAPKTLGIGNLFGVG